MRPCLTRGTCTQAPVDLPRRARAECLRQRRGGKARPCNDETAGRVLVESVHKARLLPVLAGQGLEHAVDATPDARPTLHGKAEGLVQHNHFIILIEDHGTDGGGILGRRRGGAGGQGSRPLPALAAVSGVVSALPSGGMRTACPASRRVSPFARPPSIRPGRSAGASADGRRRYPDNAHGTSGRAACPLRQPSRGGSKRPSRARGLVRTADIARDRAVGEGHGQPVASAGRAKSSCRTIPPSFRSAP